MFIATIKPNPDTSITVNEAITIFNEAVDDLYPNLKADFSVESIDDHVVVKYTGKDLDEDEFTDLCTPDEEWYLDDVSC